MSRYDRREYQRPDPPFPERVRPQKKRKGTKPWRLQARWTGENRAWFPRNREWWTRGSYATEADARKALAAHNKPGDTFMRGCYEYRIVGPDGAVPRMEE